MKRGCAQGKAKNARANSPFAHFDLAAGKKKKFIFIFVAIVVIFGCGYK